MKLTSLDKMLKVLRSNGASAFRHKEGDNFIEIIMTPGDALDEPEENDEDSEMVDTSPYTSSSVGITFKSFEVDQEEARIAGKNKLVIK